MKQPYFFRLSGRTMSLLMLTFFSCLSVRSQIHQGDLTLSTQAEVNNFAFTHIEGKLYITGGQISDLRGLTSLQSVQGLLIEDTQQLLDLEGLQQVQIVPPPFGPSLLLINRNTALQRIVLPQIDGVDRVEIQTNFALHTLTLSGLETAGSLHLNGLHSLPSVAGLSHLQQLDSQGGLSITGAYQLRTLDGLSQLRGTIKTLHLGFNQQLEQIDGLRGLTEVSESIYVYANEVLRDLDGLAGVQKTAQLRLSNLPLVSQLDSLAQIAVSTGVNLDGFPLLERLPAFENIQALQWLNLSHHAQLSDLNGFQSLTDLRELRLYGCPAIDRLDFLPNLTSRGLSLTIQQCHGLQNLRGLENLSALNEVSIAENQQLQDLTGLEQIRQIQSMWIQQNPQLRDLNGLNALESVGLLFIQGNERLASLAGLDALRQLESLQVRENPQIQQLDALTQVEGTVRRIVISGNDLLQQIDGLQGIRQVYDPEEKFALYIGYNPALQHLDGLSGLSGTLESGLRITHNQTLTNIEGLRGITDLQQTLHLTQNPELEDCCTLYPLMAHHRDELWRFVMEDNKGACTAGDIIRLGPCGSPAYAQALETVTQEAILFPNPTQGIASFYYEVERETTFRLTMYDQAGREIRPTWAQTVSPGLGKLDVDLSALQPGVYFYQIAAPVPQSPRKLVIY